MNSQQAYQDVLASKSVMATGVGPPAPPLHPALYPYQHGVTKWAIERGRAAIFADCGLGKTVMQLAWADAISKHADAPVLVFSPLAVADQTVAEASLIDVDACRTTGGSPASSGVHVTNYHRLHRFDRGDWGGVVLDESSILKNESGSTRRDLTAFVSGMSWRLACTATPAPNDLAELLNHAEYLGVATIAEAKAMFFTNDDTATQKFRLRGHAVSDFWRWVSSWAVAFRRPADHGYEQEGFDLKPYRLCVTQVEAEVNPPQGMLFHGGGLASYRQVRRETIEERVTACAEKVNADTEPWVVWCDLNAESEALAAAIPGAVEVRGADSIEEKERRLRAFSAGEARVLVTKPSIAGHGLNWQHCARVGFVGLSYSYEQFYQSVRRCWRYGQEREVEVHTFVTSESRAVLDSIQAKEKTAMQIMDFLTPHELMPQEAGSATVTEPTVETGDRWVLWHGDSVTVADRWEPESVGLAVFSPPFPGMYAYTDDVRDMGNVTTIATMIAQYDFLAVKMLRAMMPGRSALIHICQGVAQKQRDGYIGLRDFRGEIIASMVRAGWDHYGEITIDKNPQAKAVRTKARGLMFATLEKDASMMHVAMPDMMLHFRAPGDNPEPVHPEVSREQWIRWARPVWSSSDADDHGIREGNTLNPAIGREAADEKHICPLQLDVIRRVIALWSNRGDVVLSPFAGIGSEGVVALDMGRRFLGCELKDSYYLSCIKHLQQAGRQASLT